MDTGEPRRYRSIWISDIHLGTRGARAELLCDFLAHHDCETLYLVGDIVDGERLRRGGGHWSRAHSNVVRHILLRARQGVSVVYVTGNHDEFLRRYSDASIGNLHLVDEHVHTTPEGERFWVVHGDAFDRLVSERRWMVLAGDWAYEGLLHVNEVLNRVRKQLGLRHWSLSAYLKYRVPGVVAYIKDFERTVVEECRRRGYKGVICGHIHHPKLSTVQGVRYANCGDWVDSCSAVVEHGDGTLEVVRWTGQASVCPRPVRSKQPNTETIS